MTNHPSEIKLLGTFFPVVSRKHPTDYGAFVGEGCSRPVIEIDPRVPHEYVSEVLLHESIHALSFVLGEDWDEPTVATLTAGILSLLRENPELVKDIMRIKKGRKTSK